MHADKQRPFGEFPAALAGPVQLGLMATPTTPIRHASLAGLVVVLLLAAMPSVDGELTQRASNAVVATTLAGEGPESDRQQRWPWLVGAVAMAGGGWCAGRACIVCSVSM